MDSAPDVSRELRADCAHCQALCCVALAFASPADFAVSKDAGQPCLHLAPADTCTIHGELRARGFGGCSAFDCFGAGQRVSATVTDHWRDSPATAARLFATLPVVTRLHELLWYLADAAARPQCASLRPELTAAAARVDVLAANPELVDTEAVRGEVAPLLVEAGRLVRTPAGRALRHADLAGRDLTGADLVAADLRGASLLAATLRDADLRRADLIGADLRGADVRGADLSTSLYLTTAQVAAARGSGATRLPSRVERPAHWR